MHLHKWTDRWTLRTKRSATQCRILRRGRKSIHICPYWSQVRDYSLSKELDLWMAKSSRPKTDRYSCRTHSKSRRSAVAEATFECTSEARSRWCPNRWTRWQCPTTTWSRPTVEPTDKAESEWCPHRRRTTRCRTTRVGLHTCRCAWLCPTRFEVTISACKAIKKGKLCLRRRLVAP